MQSTNYSNPQDLAGLIKMLQIELGLFKSTAVISDNNYTASKHFQATIDFLNQEIEANALPPATPATPENIQVIPA
jgi:hypothetical protein